MIAMTLAMTLLITLGGTNNNKDAIPAGTELGIRLATKVASDSSKVGDKVEALLVVPVSMNGKLVLPPGTKIHGSIKEVKSTEGKPDQRAQLNLEFNEIEDGAGNKTKFSSQLADVDNARETVDDQGRINGILASETISSRMDQEIKKLEEQHGGLASFFETIKSAAMKEPQPEIVYESGVEMSLKIKEPLDIKPPQTPQNPPSPQLPAFSGPDLASMVNAQPFQSKAAQFDKPSDMTNLMFLGSKEQLEAAFKAAGWTVAAALNNRSALETFRAIAENRGYKESPVSLLVLDGQPPELVFQKQNNTFAKRHHLRIWRRPDQFLGKTVWVCSATHDTAISFSAENRTFIHKIDPHIDVERSKVTNDLEFSGLAKLLELVDRPAVPKEGSNATGDKLLTDGKMAVLFLDK